MKGEMIEDNYPYLNAAIYVQKVIPTQAILHMDERVAFWNYNFQLQNCLVDHDNDYYDTLSTELEFGNLFV